MENERTATVKNWTATEKYLFRLVFLFVPLFAVTLPYPHDLLPDPGRWLMPATTALARLTGDALFELPQPYTPQVLSDSTGAYLHVFHLLVVSLLGATVWTLLDRKRPHYRVLLYWLFALARYYLSLMLLEYGFAKVFKTQFYQPEPNTLFTPLGEITRDLAYWSVVGSSRSYNLFLGIMEVIPALLLLFRRTRLLGAFIAVGVMVNVLAVNMSFFISVKVFSAFLLLLSVLLVTPDLRRLWHFFLHGKAEPLFLWSPSFSSPGRKGMFYSAKGILILLLLTEVMMPFVTSGNFNDDTAPRPRYHGAYVVGHFVSDGDTLEPSLREPNRWQRFFVHRQGYFIPQKMDGSLQDYFLQLSNNDTTLSLAHTITFEQGWLHINQVGDSLWSLQGQLKGKELQLTARQLPYRQMPLLSEEFTWTMDAYVTY